MRRDPFAAERSTTSKRFEVDDLARLARAGHEIGCHTFGHVAVSSLTSGGLSDHIARNAEFIAEHCAGYVMSTFAYPFGDLSVAHKLLLQKRFEACRSIFPGLNAGTVDLGCLRSVALYSRSGSDAQASAIIKEAVQQRAWLIFYTHDVDVAPSRFGCTPMLLEHAIASALDAGADVMPIKNAVGAAVEFGQR